MILGGKQQQELSRVLAENPAFGRTELEMTKTARGKGFVTVIRTGWEGSAGYVVHEKVKIGAGGAVTRKKRV